jgi:hypothetical protein
MKWVKSRIPEIVNAYLAKKTYMDYEPIKEKRSKEEEIMIRLMHSVLTISEINDLDSVTYTVLLIRIATIPLQNAILPQYI